MHIAESALMCTSVTRHKKWLQFIHVSELVVPSSIMRKFVYKSGRTPSAQGLSS